RAVDGQAESSAYILMLVRPDGITNYYRTVAALQGLNIDFGYEFVDRDWVLDFPSDDESAGQQPWMRANATPASRSTTPGQTPGRKVAGFQPAAAGNLRSSAGETGSRQASIAGSNPPGVGPDSERVAQAGAGNGRRGVGGASGGGEPSG